MVKQEILVKLKNAEDDTSRRIAVAKEQAAENLKRARNDAQRLIEAAETESRRDEEARLAAERKKLDGERAKIFDQGHKQEEAAKAAYTKKADTHVQKAVATFERSL